MASPEPQSTVLDRAPTFRISKDKFVSVEHPGIVRNIDEAVASLGGDGGIEKFLYAWEGSRSIGLRLNPDDPFRKPILSSSGEVFQIVLKITVPKPTGRKRKRGSSEPFTFPESASEAPHPQSTQQDPQRRLRQLQDNAANAKVKVVGTVDECHRFRSLPDFQLSNTDNSFVNKLKKDVLATDYHALRQFKFGAQKGAMVESDFVPPPVFSKQHVQYPWAFNETRPRDAVTGTRLRRNSTSSTDSTGPREAHMALDGSKVPFGTDVHLEPEASLPLGVRKVIKEVRRILENRPIITRQALDAMMKTRFFKKNVDQAMKYCAYMLHVGPWREAYIRLGLDPRRDPEHRRYQTLNFHFKQPKPEGVKYWVKQAARADCYIFDGIKVDPHTKVYQVCDITDHLLRGILESEPPVESCLVNTSGWFNVTVWAKVRIIMRDKFRLLATGQKPNDMEYMPLATTPNNLEHTSVELRRARHGANEKQKGLMKNITWFARHYLDNKQEPEKHGQGRGRTKPDDVYEGSENDDSSHDGTSDGDSFGDSEESEGGEGDEDGEGGVTDEGPEGDGEVMEIDR